MGGQHGLRSVFAEYARPARFPATKVMCGALSATSAPPMIASSRDNSSLKPNSGGRKTEERPRHQATNMTEVTTPAPLIHLGAVCLV